MGVWVSATYTTHFGRNHSPMVGFSQAAVAQNWNHRYLHRRGNHGDSGQRHPVNGPLERPFIPLKKTVARAAQYTGLRYESALRSVGVLTRYNSIMKSRRDCKCPCHAGQNILKHVVPCCDGIPGVFSAIRRELGRKKSAIKK